MTVMVISQAWMFPGEEHAKAYERKAAAFDDFLRAQPGFVARRLVRSQDDPTHFVHLREWERIADYEAMTQLAEYQGHIEDLSVHVDPARYTQGYPREFGDVVVATDL